MKKTKKIAKKSRRCVVRHCESMVVGPSELCGGCRYFLEHALYNDSQACRNSTVLVVQRFARDLVPRWIERNFAGFGSAGSVVDAELVGLVRKDP
jgi:hypothetical protein